MAFGPKRWERRQSPSCMRRSQASKSRPASVACLCPICPMIAERRSHMSGSSIHALTFAVVLSRWLSKTCPTRWIAMASTKSHHAPSTIILRYSGIDDTVMYLGNEPA